MDLDLEHMPVARFAVGESLNQKALGGKQRLKQFGRSASGGIASQNCPTGAAKRLEGVGKEGKGALFIRDVGSEDEVCGEGGLGVAPVEQFEPGRAGKVLFPVPAGKVQGLGR